MGANPRYGACRIHVVVAVAPVVGGSLREREGGAGHGRVRLRSPWGPQPPTTVPCPGPCTQGRFSAHWLVSLVTDIMHLGTEKATRTVEKTFLGTPRH